jgi:NAD(P)-dependent dehydrogenase (short-subunit alcohol dehydrogenase family)
MNNILNQFALNDKKILITGASSGIGRQIAIHCSALGATCYITGRNEDRLNETLSLMQGSCHSALVADLTNIDDIITLCKNLEGLDGIVHSAGVVNLYPAKYLNSEEIKNTFDINYLAPVNIMTHLFRTKKINTECSVVFISSFASKYPYALGALYTGSKSALENYSKSLAIENAHFGLRSNSILPAMVKTAIYDNTINTSFNKNKEQKLDAYESLYLRGIGKPTDVANMATFLLSDASKWVTGQSIIIDGGYLLGMLSKIIS